MSKSIEAYELEKRVERYDIDMELMHPNRTKMVEMALEFLPFYPKQSINALDLGTGTGFFTKMFLEKFSNSHVIALDGAASMIELAKTRLGSLCASIDFMVADFVNLQEALPQKGIFDVIFSSFALHHLTYEGKQRVLINVHSLLKPGGWFLNADNIIAETDEVEKRFQELRVEGIVNRAEGQHDHFKDLATTRKWLVDMQTREKDNPIKLSEELKIMHNAGFKNIDILWKDYREVVCCGKN